MAIEFIQPGLQTSIQDLGRKGQMHNGISHSGAMDPLSMQLANYLVANPPGHAVLEIAQIGPKIRFHQAMTLAVTGALFKLELNQQTLLPYQSFQVSAGDILNFTKLKQGFRAYLACSTSFDISEIFASLSTHTVAGFGGFYGRCFTEGDQLECKDTRLTPAKSLPGQYRLSYPGHYILRYTPGVEAEYFNVKQQQDFQQQDWQVSPQSNRMGLRLSGHTLPHMSVTDMLSSGLLPGAIQVPPSGQPIISAMDGQTIGGYPRLGQVIQADLPLLAQIKAGDSINFLPISHQESWQLTQQQKALIAELF